MAILMFRNGHVISVFQPPFQGVFWVIVVGFWRSIAVAVENDTICALSEAVEGGGAFITFRDEVVEVLVVRRRHGIEAE